MKIALLVSLVTLISTSGYSGPREYEFLHLEQTQNIKGIYRSGVFDSQLPPEFRSDNQVKFRLPYFLIPVESPELRQINAGGPLPAALVNFQFVTQGGVRYFKHIVHPAVLSHYLEKLESKFRLVSGEESEFLAAPTASDRTLVVLDPPGANYMVKLSLPLEINHRNRTLYPTEIRRGVWLTEVFGDIFVRNPSLSNSFFIFTEPYGAYLKVDNDVFAGVIYREFSQEVYEKGKKVVPLFSLLSIDKETGKPVFFKYMTPGETPWGFFSRNILSPLLEILNVVTYKEGISLEWHSQNLVAEIDTVNNRLTRRYGYRDLGSTHLDFYSIRNQQKLIPRFEMIGDAERELGGAYSKRTEREWLYFFLKEQVFDLFFIQMAAHGIITRDERENFKKKAWVSVVQNHLKNYKGGQAKIDQREPFADVFAEVLARQVVGKIACAMLLN
ncbi:MAG: hypothetical protein JNM39_01495 [Bdellovibrionaceae bacterium]|nr:hypothetical protein [Pseudobdellovibrionaceae bacterium]